jgi:hypothetical protein
MFVELLDRLRCPHAHEDNALVATTAVTHERYIIEGTLGCSVCLAEYRVHRGMMEMAGESPVPTDAREVRTEARTEGAAVRGAALLGLDDRGGLYLVDSAGSANIESYLSMAPDSRFVAMSVLEREPAAVMSIRGRPNALPFAAGCMRGIAFDFEVPSSLMRSAVQVLAPGGRLVAPADADVPPGVELLARDGSDWVAERVATPVLNDIRRAPR